MTALALGVLVSGRGSNLQAILDAVAGGRLDAHVKLVVSNKPDALALERARRAGVPTACVRHTEYPSREAFDAAIVQVLQMAGVEWVVLAGFMRVLTPVLLRAFPHHVINIHPALLPSFPGTHAQRQALDCGVKVSGCTVHLVDEGVDTGPIIAQRAVPVADSDTEETLSERILVEEHRLLVEVLAEAAAGRLRVEPARDGRRPRVVRIP